MWSFIQFNFFAFLQAFFSGGQFERQGGVGADAYLWSAPQVFVICYLVFGP